MRVEDSDLSTFTQRSAGVLLHVTSLPSPFGIGDLGPTAHEWVRRLADAGQTWWQILPLNQPDESYSPYSAQSAFAGNVHLISVELLFRDGLLRRKELPQRVPVGRVNYGRVAGEQYRFLTIAADRFAAGQSGSEEMRKAFDTFVKREERWLEDFVLFTAIRRSQRGRLWCDWPRGLARRRPADLNAARDSLQIQLQRRRIWQFFFDRQMAELREVTKRHHVRLMGDVPIYLSYDSADVWAHPQLFQLDRDRRPSAVAGVPPDMFSALGQRWGNPLFNWKAMERDGYIWWIDRVRASLRHADVLRLDHFRGLESYWSIPSTSRTARIGRWRRGPGSTLLNTIRGALGDLPLVAEDLGIITSKVEKLRDEFGLPGMKVIQFAFDVDDSDLLPHNHPRRSIVYTGNHDTDTTAGWARHLRADVRRRLVRYCPEASRDPVDALTRLAMASPAAVAILPAQDLFRLGSDHRMNIPGDTNGVWTWRLSLKLLRNPTVWRRHREFAQIFGRLVHESK